MAICVYMWPILMCWNVHVVLVCWNAVIHIWDCGFCCCVLSTFVTTKPERHQHHHPMGQAGRHPSLRYCVFCILGTTKLDRHQHHHPMGQAGRHPSLRYSFGHNGFSPLTTTFLRGLDNPSRPRPCCTLACRCGRGPTQGTCKRELTAEGLLPSIRMRVRICVCRL